MDKFPQTSFSQRSLPDHDKRTSGITQDSIAFFREKNQILTPAQYAKIEAVRQHPLTEWRKWWNITRFDIALWPVFSILLAATYLLWQHVHLRYDRIGILMLVSFVFTIGVMMTRTAILSRPDAHIEPTGVGREQAERIGLGLQIVAIVIGAFELTHRVEQTGTNALFIGVILGVIYSIVIPLLQGSIIGEELLPAIGAGPLVFFYTIASQHLTQIVTIPAHGKIPAHAITKDVPLFTHTTWSIALGIGALLLAGLIAASMTQTNSQWKYAFHSRASMRVMKYSYLIAIIIAYAFFISAGLAKNGPHPLLITILTLPSMIIPLTGTIRASNELGLRIIIRQTGQVIQRVMLAASTGLILGWTYLELINRLHQTIK